MPQWVPPRWRNATLLAVIAATALLALVTTWTAALARVPQQRAAVERLLRAQSGLDVTYGRLVVRLGFYGPEAEFSDIEMRRPGADAPLLRAPRMVARFESWRLLRGGQLRPGRVLVSGAEVDLRQLATLRRESAPQPAPVDSVLAELEARLPSLLAGIPEGSLDFEAATLLWSDPARPYEPLQLRAPRLYASRRIDGAQLSGTLLLPTRLGRTLFVTAQLRNDAPGDGLHGRLRVSGRGLVLSSWREFGLLPASVTAGTGDVALAVQLRGGRIQQAEGRARLRGFGLIAPQPVVARRFSLASGEFAFVRTPTALRYRLDEVALVAGGATPPALGERGALELDIDPRDGAGVLRAQRLPIEVVALLLRQASGAEAGSSAAAARAAPAWRVTAGQVLELQSRWGGKRGASDAGEDSAGGDGARDGPLRRSRATLADLQFASEDGAWRIEGLGAQLVASGAHLQVALQGSVVPLQSPWFADAAEVVATDLAGSVDIVTTPQGWALAAPALSLQLSRGPALRVSGSAGAIANGTVASGWRVALGAPLQRADMALLESALQRWAPASLWQTFTAGRIEAATVELAGEVLRSASAELRGASFAAAPGRPEATALDADLDWDGVRLEGRLLGGRVGALNLIGGRVATPRRRTARDTTALELEARLTGSLQDALRIAASGSLPDALPLELTGDAVIAARLQLPAGASAGGGLALSVEVDGARWQPVASAAPLTGLSGRLRADARGLRDGRLEGRWLGGPVQLQLESDAGADLQLAARGRLPMTALAREWAWIGLVDRARDGELEWSADLRREIDDEVGGATNGDSRARGGGSDRRATRAAPGADWSPAWRMRVALPGSARADLRWVAGDGAQPAWRIDRGALTLGDGAALAGTPGALVVGGQLERLEIAGLAGAVARFASSDGWQRPLVGEVEVRDLRLGDSTFGGARLRLAGSRESTSVELRGDALAGELRQVHAEPGRLQARFARLRLPQDAAPGSVAVALLPMRSSVVLQVADLSRGLRSLGALEGTLDADGDSLATRSLTLRRGAQRTVASGRCERATLACRAELQVADAELAELLQDLGAAPSLRGREAALAATLGWSMREGIGFADSLQGNIEFSAALDAVNAGSATAALPAAEYDRTDEAPWPPLGPLLAVTARQWSDLQAASVPAMPPAAAADVGVETENGATLAAVRRALFERVEMRLAIRDGVAQIERYEAIGREARLSLAGRFDFGRGSVEQQAEWYWIAPGVAGAVERMDPRSPLAATLRGLRDLLASRGTSAAAATRGGSSAGAPERFALAGPASAPRIERLSPPEVP